MSEQPEPGSLAWCEQQLRDLDPVWVHAISNSSASVVAALSRSKLKLVDRIVALRKAERDGPEGISEMIDVVQRVAAPDAAHAVPLVLAKIAGGGGMDKAAESEGVARDTFLRWRRWAGQGREPYASLLTGLDEAVKAGKVERARIAGEAYDAKAAHRRKQNSEARMRRYIPTMDPNRSGSVYVMQDDTHGLIKVGFASHLQSRVNQYHTQAPHLRLIASFVGTFQHEREVHKALVAHRTRGREWYRVDILDLACSVIATTTGSAPSPVAEKMRILGPPVPSDAPHRRRSRRE